MQIVDLAAKKKKKCIGSHHHSFLSNIPYFLFSKHSMPLDHSTVFKSSSSLLSHIILSCQDHAILIFPYSITSAFYSTNLIKFLEKHPCQILLWFFHSYKILSKRIPYIIFFPICPHLRE